MAAVTWADVVGIAASLSTFPLAAQTDIMSHVNTSFNVSTLGGEDSSRLRLMRIYLAAHLATVSSRGGSAVSGPVTSETAGNISRSYAQLAGDASMWGATSYGQMYAVLIQTSAARLPRVF